MADAKRYRHISVTADDEEDVVVYAGARNDAPEADRGSFPGKLQPGGGRFSREQEDSRPSADAPAGAPSPYKETSLEDIESSKMPFMQKVIVVLALVALVAFALWYALMR